VDGNGQIGEERQGDKRIVQLIAVFSSPDAPVRPPSRYSPKTEQHSLLRQLATPRRFLFSQLFFSFLATLYPANFHVHKELHHDLFLFTAVWLLLARE
jgi:hypothetical protein